MLDRAAAHDDPANLLTQDTLAGDPAAVPAQAGAGGDQPVRSQPSRQESDQRGQHRPVGPVHQGRG
jgi:hypothetical protein